jgi:thiol-disulfide isomerase/thioredoxin
MKRFRPTLVTLLVAHVVGSYCGGLFPLILERVLHHNHNALIFGTWSHVFAGLALPAIIPLFLVSETVGAFPHYYHSLPQYWACYTVPFVMVCLIRHKKSSVIRLAMTPVMATLFVIVTYQLLPERVSLGLAPEFDLTALEHKPAPDFTLTTLSGTTCSLSQERGHVVLLDFWFKDCAPCQLELNQLTSKLADDDSLRRRGLRVWTINVADDTDATRKFMDRNHYDFTVMFDRMPPPNIRYPRNGCPATYVMGRDGSIKKVFSGFGEDIEKSIRAEIDFDLKQ